MHVTKGQRTLSLLLCLLMAMSFLAVSTPIAYAAERGSATSGAVDWPQLTKLEEVPTIMEWKNVNWAVGSSPATIKDYKITQYAEKKSPPSQVVIPADVTAYEVGLTVNASRIRHISSSIRWQHLRMIVFHGMGQNSTAQRRKHSRGKSPLCAKT